MYEVDRILAKRINAVTSTSASKQKKPNIRLSGRGIRRRNVPGSRRKILSWLGILSKSSKNR
jgi:hypothetical protein